jgi:RNA polymerase subunit RPABC4/transcription elongation factor Spt4
MTLPKGKCRICKKCKQLIKADKPCKFCKEYDKARK